MKKNKSKVLGLLFGAACIALASLNSSCKKTDPVTVPGDPTTVTDIDGNVYGVVRIGTQLWTTENLRTTRYNDGTPITTALSNTAWTSATSGSYGIYDDNSANNITYGKLYNWYAVNTGKLAPAGWHVPATEEFNLMVETLGGSSVAGGKLKSTSSLWDAPNTGATNSSGFNGLPGGYRGSGGGYSLMGRSGYWWTSTQANAGQGRYFLLDNDFASSGGNGATKTFGYSVRLVRD